MTLRLRDGMTGATRLVRTGQLAEATALLQLTLRGSVEPAAAAAGTFRLAAPPALAGDAETTLPSAFDGLMSDIQGMFDGFGSFNPFAPPSPTPQPVKAKESGGPTGSFVKLRLAHGGGERAYRLYVPAACDPAVPMPLVVMLHGCTQSPEDFAAGTRMNEHAERDGLLVCYPEQTSASNGQKCWNWFNDGNQRRDRGEPALIAAMTRDVMTRHAVDPTRVYVAGLSAGGALAATMGQAYPDLYAAVGVHSGLACGAASDMPSAFAAMRQGGGSRSVGDAGTGVPTIVFHGDRDATVAPVNGDEVAAQAMAQAAAKTDEEEGRVPGGHRYRVTRHRDAAGQALVERWTIHGAGHAWAGGSPAGSYTDPQGPDASREMLRFFAESGVTR